MNKSDIMKAAELSYEERVEKAARAIFEVNPEEYGFSGKHYTWEQYRKSFNNTSEEIFDQARAALKAAGIDQLLKSAELLKQVEVVEDLPMLIKRCLTFGIEILPYQLKGVLRQYNQKKIPDDILAKLDKPKLQEYVKGLYYSSCEMAGDWTKGHEILKTLGFNEVERREGHRVFVSLQYEPPVIIDKEGV